MNLSITLQAENKSVRVQIYLGDSNHQITVIDIQKKESSVRGFIYESNMWAYINNLNLQKEDFKVVPF